MLQTIGSFLSSAARGLWPRAVPKSHYVGNSRENEKAAYFSWHLNDCSGQAESSFVCVLMSHFIICMASLGKGFRAGGFVICTARALSAFAALRWSCGCFLFYGHFLLREQ